MKLALKLSATLLIACLCFAAGMTILALQLKFTAFTQGYGGWVLYMPLRWIPIVLVTFVGLALRQWWLAATLPVYLLISYAPATVMSMVIAGEIRKETAALQYSTDGLPGVTEYVRIRPGGAGLDDYDRSTLLSGAVARMVAVSPYSWDPRFDPLDEIDLGTSEIHEFRRVGIDECPSEEYLRLPVETDRASVHCVLEVPFTGTLPRHALLHTERDTPNAREYVFALASLSPSAPAAEGEGEGGNKFSIQHDLEIIQRAKKVHGASYLPQNWLLRSFFADKDSGRKKPKRKAEYITARYPERDYNEIYSDLFPAPPGFPAAPEGRPGIDLYVADLNAAKYGRILQDVTATKPPEDWLEGLQSYYDAYMQNVPDASQSDIYRRLRTPALIFCKGGHVNELTVSVLAGYSVDKAPCLEDLPADLLPAVEDQRARLALRTELEDRLEDLKQQRLLALGEAFPVKPSHGSIRAKGETLFQDGKRVAYNDFLGNELRLAAVLYPDEAEYEAEITAYFVVPEESRQAENVSLACPGMPPLQLAETAELRYSHRDKRATGKATLRLTETTRDQLATGLNSGSCELNFPSNRTEYFSRLPAGREFYILQGLYALEAANRSRDKIGQLRQELASLD
ncbi:MAG: hypothetical protein R3B94_15505 [Hyphomonas sp.]